MKVRATLVSAANRTEFQEKLDQAIEDEMECVGWADCLHVIRDIKFASDTDGFGALVIVECPEGATS